MRQIEWTGLFKRDYRRELKGGNKKIVEPRLSEAVNYLANDIQLASKYRDHALLGNWRDHRSCHLSPDLVLIYRLVGNESLQLVRLGSHSKLRLT